MYLKQPNSVLCSWEYDMNLEKSRNQIENELKYQALYPEINDTAKITS